MQATTIGLDIAKSVFQVHGVDERGRVVLRKRLARAKVLEFFANLPRMDGSSQDRPSETRRKPLQSGRRPWMDHRAVACSPPMIDERLTRKRRERPGIADGGTGS